MRLYAANAKAGRDPFLLAARHSRWVRRLRIAVPMTVVLALLAILLVSVFNPWRMLINLPLNTGALVVSGTKITMEAPRLAGFTPDRRAYELAAKAAAQDLRNPGKIELNELTAKIEMQDKSQVKLTARQGLYDTKAEILKLVQGIDLQTTSGYESHLSSAVVDIRKGTIKSDEPVTVKFLNGDLKAHRLDISDNGALAIFGGGVVMTVMLNGTQPAAQALVPQPAATQ